MKKLILIVVVSVALLFVGCKSENSNEVSSNTSKVETTAITTTTNSKSGWQHLNEKSEKEFRADLGNPKVDKNAKINYVSATAKKKIKAVNLTKKQMSILIDHVMVLSGISSKPNLLCFYIEDYNKYIMVFLILEKLIIPIHTIIIVKLLMTVVEKHIFSLKKLIKIQ